jgi:hypothetical protein
VARVGPGDAEGKSDRMVIRRKGKVIHKPVLEREWMTYKARARWHSWLIVRTQGRLMYGDGARHTILCRRCHQTRVISAALWQAHSIARGCPPVPFLARLSYYVKGCPIPSWEVNEGPPWLAMKKR